MSSSKLRALAVAMLPLPHSAAASLALGSCLHTWALWPCKATILSQWLIHRQLDRADRVASPLRMRMVVATASIARLAALRGLLIRSPCQARAALAAPRSPIRRVCCSRSEAPPFTMAESPPKKPRSAVDDSRHTVGPTYAVPGLVITEHTVTVPLDHTGAPAAPGRCSCAGAGA